MSARIFCERARAAAPSSPRATAAPLPVRHALPRTIGVALLLGPPLAAAATEPPVQVFAPIVVTAVMQDSPLTVITDPKAPRQPVPASDGADFLKTIPGFAVIRKGGSNGDPVLRGMTGSRLNILIDGGQIGGGCPSRMDPPTAYISPQLYDRVTVIKGPETVQYGPGNSAGTVLFERDFKRYTQPGHAFEGSLLGGSNGRNDQMVDLRAGTPDVYMGISANHTHAQDYEDGDGHRVHSYYDRWNADLTLGWTPDDDTRLELTAGKGDGKAAYAFSGMDGAQFLRESAGLKFEQRYADSALEKLEAQLYYNYADHVMDNYTLRRPDPSGMMPMAMASDVARTTVGGRVAASFRWDESLELVAGADGPANTHNARMGGPAGGMLPDYRNQPRLRDARIGTLGAFGELRWTLAERDRLVSGARLDRAHARGYRLTAPATGMGGMGGMGGATKLAASRSSTLPAGFVRYEHDLAAAPATFYAGIGHVERFPDYWELFGQHVDKSVAAFRRLDPERTTQLDVGLQYNDDQRLKAWVSGYVGVVDDFILLDYGRGMMGKSQARNVRARIAGTEAGLVYAFDRHWKGDATLSWAWGENQSDHRPLPQMPPLEARLGLTYDSGIWSVGALWRVASAQHRVAPGSGNIVGQDLGPGAGFGVFSLNAGYRLSRTLTLSAGVDNLLDKTYAEHVNAANAGLVGYVNTLRVNEPGRTGWLKLDVKL
ncbi:TonB-dependent copper receptor [Rhodanobacter sp. FW510-R12]|uniref:TonB-dependent copper receptor n=1 Tax=unclassified Rhodanobacter TaxID=2621553 RepID=UPI0007AA26F4|nr:MULTISPECIES: TonB-dependent copper receptor [unclassified Rhodanobacter]KZC15380.1 TonB-dependent copper receptor [Rhodanobacter sp. FW104-R8]KZC25515.1 TonB-dependent copper receptor [Rhodanobacter sp. FW510-T8]KZC30219.1 TonB-dependent copper receptor [Rhodanobacter sp. FW510-R10]